MPFSRSSLYWGKVVSLGIILGLGIQFAQAWSNPTQPAPSGNVDGPITTSLFSQIKQGSLVLLGNLTSSMIQINGVATLGNACPSTGLVARNTTGALLSCQGGVWTGAMGGSFQLITHQNALSVLAGKYTVPMPNSGAAATAVIPGSNHSYIVSQFRIVSSGRVQGKDYAGIWHDVAEGTTVVGGGQYATPWNISNHVRATLAIPYIKITYTMTASGIEVVKQEGHDDDPDAIVRVFFYEWA